MLFQSLVILLVQSLSDIYCGIFCSFIQVGITLALPIILNCAKGKKKQEESRRIMELLRPFRIVSPFVLL